MDSNTGRPPVAKSRLTYDYTIPPSLRWEGGPMKFSLRQLSANEEMQASKVGGFDLVKGQVEATKRAICEIDGKRVTIADAVLEQFWESAGQKLRGLIVQKYVQLSTASNEEAESFSASETIRVG